MENLTLKQANARLALVNSPDDIIDILKEIDINSSGSTTVFYSGIKNDIIDVISTAGMVTHGIAIMAGVAFREGKR